MGRKQTGLSGTGIKGLYPYLAEPSIKEINTEFSHSFVSVRPPEKIPPSLLAYFKFHPRHQRVLSLVEKQLHAQVYLHEIEEGARVLIKNQHNQQAAVLTNFENAMHPEQRLDLVRQLLRHPALQKRRPEQSQHHKIRHNQWGFVQGQLGKHPCVAFTAPGPAGKTRNEDAFLMLSREKVLAVADGMGGAASGDIASCVAIDFFEDAICRGSSLPVAIAHANEAILLRQQSENNLNLLRPMGSTLSAIQLSDHILQIAHMGDTKVVVLRDGKAIWESTDHTKGQQLFREGLVDEDTALELNHILIRCLGHDSVQPTRDVDYTEMHLQSGDRVLVMSDGITDNFFDPGFQLSSLYQLGHQGNAQEALKKILNGLQTRLQKDRLPNGRSPKLDNISLALVDFQG